MTIHFERALQEIVANRYVNLMTIMTIGLCTLFISVFGMFYENGARIMSSWNQGDRILVFLHPEVSSKNTNDVQNNLKKMEPVESITFISRKDALEALKQSMPSGTAYLENLERNPLPDSFIVKLKPNRDKNINIADIAAQISKLSHIESVDYGEAWIKEIKKVLDLFRITGIFLMILFSMVTLFVVGNTVRLSLYAREEEFDVMRLVGATEAFMAIPFHITAIIQGVTGALSGFFTLGILYYATLSIIKNFNMMEQSALPMSMEVQFISPYTMTLIFAGAVLLCWVGSFFSLKRHLKN
ncbi:cell division protein FtsX [Desulfamplus magnetovallimortis]|nr:ABC transporter permease [Desulfamplus magnetovallimortis]